MRAALAALPRFRARAQARMTSRCTVMRKDGFEIVDRLKVPVWAAVHVDLPTRVHTDPRASMSRTDTAGGVDVESAVRVESFPYGTALGDGDLVLITAGENDDEVFRIIDATPADQQTACRVKVVQTTRPPEWE